MFRCVRILIAASAGLLAAAPVPAATLNVKGVTLPGGIDTVLTTIGANGTLGGVAFFPAAGATLGFVYKGEEITILPKPTEAALHTAVVPTFIDGPFVTAIWSERGGFTGILFKDGAYQQSFALGTVSGMRLLKRSSAGIFIADIPDGAGGYLFKHGKPSADHGSLPEVKLDPSSFLVSINKNGVVAGTYNPGQPSVFTRSGGNLANIAVPGAVATNGGFINDAGAIAGTYTDAHGSIHGYVWSTRVISSFDPPKPATAMQVNGFSNTGYVAGTYTTPDGNQTGFRYQRDGTFLTYGPYAPQREALYVVGVSDDGTVAFDLTAAATGQRTPYLAVCSGAGC